LGFDSYGDPSQIAFLGESPRDLTGEGVNIANLGTTPSISSISFNLYSGAVQDLEDLQEVVSFWTYNSEATGSAPAFTTNLYSMVVDLGAMNITTQYSEISVGNITLPTPLQLSSSTVGVEFFSEANTGSGLTADPNVTMGIDLQDPPTVGSLATPEGVDFYTNWSNEGTTTTYGLHASDLSSFGANMSDCLVFQLYGTAAPEPFSIGFLSLSVLGLLGRGRLVSQTRRS
jgi:hypothetical protein